MSRSTFFAGLARWFFGGLFDNGDDRGDVQFFELLRGDGRRALGHEVLTFLRLREGNDVADAGALKVL